MLNIQYFSPTVLWISLTLTNRCTKRFAKFAKRVRKICMRQWPRKCRRIFFYVHFFGFVLGETPLFLCHVLPKTIFSAFLTWGLNKIRNFKCVFHKIGFPNWSCWDFENYLSNLFEISRNTIQRLCNIFLH